jgi:hypothetical protein
VSDLKKNKRLPAGSVYAKVDVLNKKENFFAKK